MAWTTSDLEALEAAIATGTLSVKYFDKMVTYRTLDEMLKIRDLMRESLGVTSGRTKRIFADFDKGIC